LGLAITKEIVERFKGKIHISSKGLKEGVQATILFPKTKPPAYYVSLIDLRYIEEVIIIEKGNSIQKMWQQRIKKGSASAGLIGSKVFASIEAFLKSIDSKRSKSKNCVLLVDAKTIENELAGLDILAGVKVANIVILTGPNPGIVRTFKVRRKVLKISPKELLEYIPIIKN
jgi:hypothetical protein